MNRIQQIRYSLTHPLAALKIAWWYGVYPALFLERRYGDRARCTLTLDDGTEVAFATTDPYARRWFFPRLDKNRFHEPAVTRALLAELEGCRGFADVGAHLGYYACLAGKRGARVWAFEMDAHSFRLLEENVAVNELDGAVTLEARAVADEEKTVYFAAKNGPNPALHIGERSRDGAVAVPAVDLDTYFADEGEPPDLLKIDVEGAELLVLQGMSALLAERPRLFIELHPHAWPEFDTTPQALFSLLDEAGYELRRIDGLRSDHEGGAPVTRPAQLDANVMLFAAPRGEARA